MSTCPFQATVVITTFNRKEELRTAIHSCLEQTAKIELLVVDDGSTDGTTKMVGTEFPDVRLITDEVSKGLIVQRNNAAPLAKSPIIISIDDDATFASPEVVEQTLADFDHPRVAAVAIPYKDVNDRQIIRVKPPPDRQGVWVCEQFIGTAHALRRDVFLQLNGYRSMLYNRCEERDYCVRLLNHGYVTRLGRSDFIHHHESGKRSSPTISHYLARNFVLFPWHNAPTVNLPVHLAGATINQMRLAFRRSTCRTHALRGIAHGYVDMIRTPGERRPVSRKIYRLFRQLQYTGPIEIGQIKAQLPPLPPNDNQRAT